jgi:hypothetical protein
VGRPYGGKILGDDGFCGSPAVLPVSEEPADEAQVRWSLDIESKVEQTRKGVTAEHVGALHHDHLGRLHGEAVCLTPMAMETILRGHDRPSRLQGRQVAHQEIMIAYGYVVEVIAGRIKVWRRSEIAIVPVFADEDPGPGRKRLNQGLRQGCFS